MYHRVASGRPSFLAGYSGNSGVGGGDGAMPRQRGPETSTPQFGSVCSSCHVDLFVHLSYRWFTRAHTSAPHSPLWG